MREIEIKLKVSNLDVLKNKLQEAGCVLSDEISQFDTIYSNKKTVTREWNVPQEGDLVLRIRRENEISEFNIKKQRSHELDNIEYETKVEDPEILHKMLLRCQKTKTGARTCT